MRRRIAPQPEVRPLVVRGQIAARRGHGNELRSLRGGQLDLRANAIAVALVPHQFDPEPVVARRRLVAHDVSRAAVGRHHYVHAAVVPDVACCQPAPGPRFMEDLARCARHVHEALAVVAHQQHWFLVAQLRIVQLDVVDIVSLRHDQVFPAVVVVVEKIDTPARMKQRRPGHAGGIA